MKINKITSTTPSNDQKNLNYQRSLNNFDGYASIFNVLDLHNDIILPQAFDNINNSPIDVKLLWQHNLSQPIGYINSFAVDSVGLFVTGYITLNTQHGREAVDLIANNITSYLSIGFDILSSYHKDNIQYITSIMLYEVSVVTIPANPLCIVKCEA